jgi:hypothetical protein
MPNIPSQPTQPKSEEERAKQQELFDKINQIQHRLMLAEQRSTVEGAERNLKQAQEYLTMIREKGHKFDEDLEDALSAQEPEIKEARELLDRHLDAVNRTLRPEFDSVMRQLESAAVSGWQLNSLASRIENGERELARIESEIETRIRGAFTELSALTARTRNLAWSYRQAEEASFDLGADDALVSAWEAQWLAEDEKSGPKGVLYLTSHQIIFEQKEKVKMKKGLFAKKQFVQKLAFHQPLAVLAKSLDAEKRRFLGKKELLNLEFKSGEPLKVSLHLKTDSAAVDARIEEFAAIRQKEEKEKSPFDV